MTWTLTGGTKCTNGLIILCDLKKAPACKTSSVEAIWASSLHSHPHPGIGIEFYTNKQGLERGDTFKSLALNVVSLNFFSRILKSTASLWLTTVDRGLDNGAVCPEKAVKILWSWSAAASGLVRKHYICGSSGHLDRRDPSSCGELSKEDD